MRLISYLSLRDFSIASKLSIHKICQLVNTKKIKKVARYKRFYLIPSSELKKFISSTNGK